MTIRGRVLFAVFAMAAIAWSAQPPARGDAADDEATKAVAAFDASFAKADPDERLQLVATLNAVKHAKATERIARVAEDERADAGSRAACFAALAERGKADKTVVARVGKWIASESAIAARAMAKGDCGVPIDPRSGEVDKNAPTVKRAISDGERQAKVAAAAIRTARALAWKPKEAAETIGPFLQSPYDDLAVAALETTAAWKSKESLRDLLQLFRMYPKENRWESGAVTHGGGNNATAQRAWMVMFGHPLKQRPRPTVVRALTSALEAVCGRRVETPEALEAFVAQASSGSSRR